MTKITTYKDKKLLIIDDMPEMRSALRSQASSIGFEQISVCGNVRDALDTLRGGRFDVILCDYNLGPGTDGQQLLEHLRARRLISRGTLYIMVTAEKNYDSVITAAECLPDDYLLKPFTAETFRQRLERLLERKRRLARVDALQDAERWAEVVSACDEIIAARDRYLVDAMRIKGNALFMDGRYAEAEAFYREAIAMRPMPWARLGLARAQRQLGNNAARATLETLIAESPQLMAAYDLLGHVHADEGNTEAALRVLDSAAARSPRSLNRLRAIASVAEEAGDYARVQDSLDKVVRQTRHTPLRDPGDYARLGKALTVTDQADKALELVDDARSTFREDGGGPALAAIEALAHQRMGAPEKAAAALQRALDGDLGKLSPEALLTVANACLASGDSARGEELLKRAVQTNPEAKAVQLQVTRIMSEHGIADHAEKLVSDSVQEVVQLNNDAVRLGKEGRIGEAAAMLTAAADRLPGNLQIVANAAYALLVDMLASGSDATRLENARRFREHLRKESPGHRKLADIDALWARLQPEEGGG